MACQSIEAFRQMEYLPQHVGQHDRTLILDIMVVSQEGHLHIDAGMRLIVGPAISATFVYSQCQFCAVTCMW